VKDTGWDQVKDFLLAINFECMSSIMTALKAAHCLRTFCQSIYNFSFTLITPLQAQDKGVIAHGVLVIAF
jgi:hypothetical protein